MIHLRRVSFSTAFILLFVVAMEKLPKCGKAGGCDDIQISHIADEK